mmetsp:Transcript_2802/g.10213  ORF Transcript_2802/g.10213 Transcript_2802/m.10213 type:complete len:226 (-) Transcript_2802:120-797(-)
MVRWSEELTLREKERGGARANRVNERSDSASPLTSVKLFPLMIAATGILASVQFAKLALTVWKGRRAKPVKKFPGKGQRVGRSGFRFPSVLGGKGRNSNARDGASQQKSDAARQTSSKNSKGHGSAASSLPRNKASKNRKGKARKADALERKAQQAREEQIREETEEMKRQAHNREAEEVAQMDDEHKTFTFSTTYTTTVADARNHAAARAARNEVKQFKFPSKK